MDDGKSTLIGRLLYESKSLFDDQLSALERDSKRHGTQGEEIDYALLLDGLDAEREQGITIDVAYRYFSTDKRSFIVADCPGHEQYTRNMATGASTADLAVVLVDARKGLLTQTRRHSYIAALFGIRASGAGGQQDGPGRLLAGGVRAKSRRTYGALAASSAFRGVTAIPLSGLVGDNVVPALAGDALVSRARACWSTWKRSDVDAARPAAAGFPHAGAMGLPSVAGFPRFRRAGRRGRGEGRRRSGQRQSGRRSQRDSICPGQRAADGGREGQSILLTLADEIDISRGDIVAAADEPPPVSDQFGAHLLWMGDEPLLPGRHYWLKLGTRTVAAQVTEIKHKADINTQEHIAAKRLLLNEVARLQPQPGPADRLRDACRQPPCSAASS